VALRASARRKQLTRPQRSWPDLDVGAMPICGEDNRLHGMPIDRDTVVKAIAVGRDPARMSAAELATQDEVVTIDGRLGF
jgi:hypothetical protein